MKIFIKEYFHIIVVVLCALTFGLGFYYILLNAFHMSSVSKRVIASEYDIYYSGYETNLQTIKNKLNNYSYGSTNSFLNSEISDELSSKLRYCSTVLSSKEGFFANNRNSEIGYKEVYDLNDYFLNKLVDSCFTSNIYGITVDNKMIDSTFMNDIGLYKEIVDILADNSNYLKDELRDNSSYYYNTGISNAMTRNNLDSSYRKIVKNYYEFSNVILYLTNYLTGGVAND